MSSTHQKGCECSAHPNSTAQTLSELEFERGVWNAAIENDTPKLIKLLNNGNDPNQKDNSGYTALHYAARAGNNDVLKILLSHGADPNSLTSAGGATPLHRAGYMGNLGGIEILIKYKARVDISDSDGKTVLHKCAEKGQYDCAKFILENSGEFKTKILDMKDKRGNSPYVYAKLYQEKEKTNCGKLCELLSLY